MQDLNQCYVLQNWRTFSRTAGTIRSLKLMIMNVSEESANADHRLRYLMGFDQCFADSFIQQVTVVSVVFWPPDAILTEVGCQTQNRCMCEGVGKERLR